MHLLVDSTGLKLCGKGEWLLEKHGTATRRAWRMLHLGVDAGTGRIVASTLSLKEVDDASQADPLLDQVAGSVASFTADGACDQDCVYAGVAERHPEAVVVVPPRSRPCPATRLRAHRRSGTATFRTLPGTGACPGRPRLATTGEPRSKPP